MDSAKKSMVPAHNPKTHATHKKQAFWQITLPLVIGVLILLAALILIILSAMQPVTDLTRWAGVSIIWLILPSLFFALILLAILVGLVYGIGALNKAIPPIAYRIQLFLERLKGKIATFSGYMAEPVLRVRSFWAVAHKLRQLLRNRAQGQ